jgi:dihydroorotate dehydrogenase
VVTSLLASSSIENECSPELAYSLIRPLLFAVEAERAHEWATAALRAAQRSAWLRRRFRGACRVDDARLGQRVLGRLFANPVGVAAGFDKDARMVPGLAALGFGAVEVGTVTPRPQPGNPRPRLWRHPAVRSLQNRLGFNSAGAAVVAANLKALGGHPVPVGVNLGVNRDTPREEAAADYARLVEALDGLADYFVVNVSSPNTPGLRDLQAADLLAKVLAATAQRTTTPVLVKIAPDMPAAAAVELGEAAVEAGAAGLIATNTTVDYDLIPGAERSGGLSGAVLRERSFTLLQALAGALAGRCVLISVGGVDSAREAYRRLRAGASLVQLYSALIYEGPGLAGRINRGLLRLLEDDGLSDITAAIGADL